VSESGFSLGKWVQTGGASLSGVRGKSVAVCLLPRQGQVRVKEGRYASTKTVKPYGKNTQRTAPRHTRGRNRAQARARYRPLDAGRARRCAGACRAAGTSRTQSRQAQGRQVAMPDPITPAAPPASGDMASPSTLPPGPPAPAPAAQPAPPPAASAVLNADVIEGDAAEVVALRRQLDAEKAGRKADQTRLSELEDENRRLKTPPTRAPEKKSWLDGATLLG